MRFTKLKRVFYTLHIHICNGQKFAEKTGANNNTIWEELVTPFTVEEEPTVEREVKTTHIHHNTHYPSCPKQTNKTQTNKIPKQDSPVSSEKCQKESEIKM